MNKVYTVDVHYQGTSVFRVEAKNPAEAKEKAKEFFEAGYFPERYGHYDGNHSSDIKQEFLTTGRCKCHGRAPETAEDDFPFPPILCLE